MSGTGEGKRRLWPTPSDVAGSSVVDGTQPDPPPDDNGIEAGDAASSAAAARPGGGGDGHEGGEPRDPARTTATGRPTDIPPPATADERTPPDAATADELAVTPAPATMSESRPTEGPDPSGTPAPDGTPEPGAPAPRSAPADVPAADGPAPADAPAPADGPGPVDAPAPADAPGPADAPAPVHAPAPADAPAPAPSGGHAAALEAPGAPAATDEPYSASGGTGSMVPGSGGAPDGGADPGGPGPTDHDPARGIAFSLDDGSAPSPGGAPASTATEAPAARAGAGTPTDGPAAAGTTPAPAPVGDRTPPGTTSPGGQADGSAPFGASPAQGDSGDAPASSAAGPARPDNGGPGLGSDGLPRPGAWYEAAAPGGGHAPTDGTAPTGGAPEAPDAPRSPSAPGAAGAGTAEAASPAPTHQATPPPQPPGPFAGEDGRPAAASTTPLLPPDPSADDSAVTDRPDHTRGAVRPAEPPPLGDVGAASPAGGADPGAPAPFSRPPAPTSDPDATAQQDAITVTPSAPATGPGWAGPAGAAGPGGRPRITPPGGTTRVGDDDAPGHIKRSGHRRRPVALVAAVPLLILVLLIVGWAIDSAALSGQVVRNVEVAGRPVGGLGEASLPDVISDIAEETAARPVRITSGAQTYETTAGEIGLTLDQEATAEAALDAGRDDSIIARPIAWFRSFFDAREIPVQFQASEAAVGLKLLQLQGGDVTAPVEPTIALDGATGEFVVVPGRAGSGIDARQVAADLPGAAEASTGTIKISADDTDVSPRFSDDDAQQLATRANEMTAPGLTLIADQTRVPVDAATLRTWIRPAEPADGEMRLEIIPEAVNGAFPTLFAGLSAEPKDASFDLQNGAPVVVPAANGVACCGENGPQLVWEALDSGGTEVTLETQVVEPELTTAEAEALGIREAVGGSRAYQNGSEVPGPGPGFTTYHAAGEARVTNIHRIADIVRGTVVLPGETFSINEVAGQRTTANGFVPAGAISQGQHVEEVGGGVSQFATTTFNAAYFGGYDITEYQAHSEWFTRYPPGREATMGYPSPDLKFENNSDYGILVWTSYTDTSLTVTLYSTPYATAEQTGSTESMSGQCRVVETTRTRTFAAGGTDTDTFKATYRPGPGIDCNGQPIAP